MPDLREIKLVPDRDRDSLIWPRGTVPREHRRYRCSPADKNLRLLGKKIPKSYSDYESVLGKERSHRNPLTKSCRKSHSHGVEPTGKTYRRINTTGKAYHWQKGG